MKSSKIILKLKKDGKIYLNRNNSGVFETQGTKVKIGVPTTKGVSPFVFDLQDLLVNKTTVGTRKDEKTNGIVDVCKLALDDTGSTALVFWIKSHKVADSFLKSHVDRNIQDFPSYRLPLAEIYAVNKRF